MAMDSEADMMKTRSNDVRSSQPVAMLRRFVWTIAVVAGSLTAVATASHAFTADQQRLCTDDAFRLCGSELSNFDRIATCLRQNRNSLSAGCKSVFDK